MTDQPLPEKKGSAPFALAYWFVTEYLKRPWNADDAKGRHLKHAQILLKDDSADLIKGCLRAMRDGRINVGKFEIRWLVDVRNGEPPFISSYRELASKPPPQWMTTSYREWQKEFDPHAAAVVPPPYQESDLCLHFPPPTSLSSVRLHTRASTRRT